MNPDNNPFAPGAGTPPPQLAGRGGILQAARTELSRLKAGRPARGMLLLGLRGVGKTVLLIRIEGLATELGCIPILLEAPEERRLPELLVPPLRGLLLRLSRGKRVADQARRALRALRGFASAFRVRIGEFEVGVEPEPGTADSGDLETDLADLLALVADAAREEETAVALLLDELQYLESGDLSALIVAAHRLTQRGLPLLIFGAGLPRLAALAGDAKSYAERLFDYPEVGRLDPDAAGEALREPLRRGGVEIEAAALAEVVQATQGYPYFLQEWGYHLWNVAVGSPITGADAERAAREALEHLDAGFFRVRFDRLTPREQDYVRAMAELGEGPSPSGEIAAVLGEKVTTVAPLRQAIILKGVIYSPSHGLTAFTVPMFGGYLRRTIPDWHPAPKRRRGRPRKKDG